MIRESVCRGRPRWMMPHNLNPWDSMTFAGGRHEPVEVVAVRDIYGWRWGPSLGPRKAISTLAKFHGTTTFVADEVISKSLTIPWSHDIHVQLPTVACRPRKKLVMRTPAMAVFPFAACFIWSYRYFYVFLVLLLFAWWRACTCGGFVDVSVQLLFLGALCSAQSTTARKILHSLDQIGLGFWFGSIRLRLCFHCSAYTLCLVRGLFELIATFLKVFLWSSVAGGYQSTSAWFVGVASPSLLCKVRAVRTPFRRDSSGIFRFQVRILSTGCGTEIIKSMFFWCNHWYHWFPGRSVLFHRFQKIWMEPLGLEGLPAHHPKTRDGWCHKVPSWKGVICPVWRSGYWKWFCFRTKCIYQ